VVGHFIDYFVGQSHLFKSLFLFIYSFHMPLFLFVSGLFHKNKRIKEKIISYFSIYLVYKIATIATQAVLQEKWSFTLFSDSQAPWYMFAMMVFILLAYVLRDINNKLFVLLLALGVGCCSGYDASIGDFLITSRIIVFFPFYYLGTLVPSEKLEQMGTKTKWKIIGLLVLAVWFGICYFKIDSAYILRHLFTGRNPFNDTVRPIGAIIRLGCYFITALSGLSFILMIPNRRMGYFTTAGSRSLQVYFWHLMILYILKHFGWLDQLVAMGGIGKIILLIVAVGVTFLCSTKLFSQPTNFLMKAPAMTWKTQQSCVEEKHIL